MSTLIAISILMALRLGALLAIGRRWLQSAFSFATAGVIIIGQYAIKIENLTTKHRLAFAVFVLILAAPALISVVNLKLDHSPAKRNTDLVTIILFAVVIFYQVAHLV